MAANDTLHIKIVDWQDDQTTLQAIREQVFIIEQNVPEALEWDKEDDTAIHCIAYFNKQAVATARLQKDGQLGRMAVLEDFRGRGIGSKILKFMLEHHKARGLSSIFLHAQTHATGFYKKFGFVTEGDEYLEAGIPHYSMILEK